MRRPLADLGQGARGRIVAVRLPPGRRFLPESPLQPGADVYVAEAPGGRWLHVRIDFREYSVPPPSAPATGCPDPAAGGRPAGR